MLGKVVLRVFFEVDMMVVKLAVWKDFLLVALWDASEAV